MSTSSHPQPPSNDPAPGANIGFSRLRWVEPGGVRAFALAFTPPNSDFVAMLLQALEQLGFSIEDARGWSSQAITEALSGAGRAGLDRGAGARLLVLEQTEANLDLALSSRRRDPWIVYFDDLCALALGAETHRTGAAATLSAHAERQLQCVRALERHGGDLMIGSFRKMREFPEQHLSALLNFLGHEPADGSLKSAQEGLAREDEPYSLTVRTTLPSTFLFQGMVDQLCKRGIVAGWVKDVLDDRRIDVRVLVDDKEVAREPADFAREDLKKLNLGDGAYGFAIDIGRFLGAEPKRVEVRTVERDFTVGELEMTLSRGVRISNSEQ